MGLVRRPDNFSKMKSIFSKIKRAGQWAIVGLLLVAAYGFAGLGQILIVAPGKCIAWGLYRVAGIFRWVARAAAAADRHFKTQ